MIDSGDAAVIDGHVGRLLDEAGARNRFPTPVSDLVAAQHLALLDEDASLFSLSMIASAPLEIRTRMAAMPEKVLAMLDRSDRLVHLDPTGLAVQRRFWTCHELGHDLCPWHDARLYLDGASTLDPAVYTAFEEEANYAAVRLLYQQEAFTSLAREVGPCFRSLQQLAEHFGGSIHSAFRLYIESSTRPVGGYVLATMPVGADPSSNRFRVKACFASAPFQDRYAHLDTPPRQLDMDQYLGMAEACRRVRAGLPADDGRLYILTRHGEREYLRFELFTNRYSIFLLLHQYGAVRGG